MFGLANREAVCEQLKGWSMTNPLSEPITSEAALNQAIAYVDSRTTADSGTYTNPRGL